MLISLLFLVWSALQTGGHKPSIVLVLTDDQDVSLDSLTPMTKLKKYVGEVGITFENAFVTTPICCPSRSSILTGLYMRNHETWNNSLEGGCSSRTWQENYESRTFGAILHESGYRTFYAGKYLNQYGHKKSGGVGHVPDGWDWWIGLLGNSVYYNYTLSVNGTGVFRGEGEEDYLTDVLRDYSLEFLRDQSRPFLMVVSVPSPHEPFTPANRHRGKFAGFKAPRTPNFNRPGDGSNKHWLLRLPPDVLPDAVVEEVDNAFRNRWETLLAVDELLERIILALNEKSNAYVIFTSDNGFHLGQFGLPWDKRQPYETDIRIPLVMTGPEVPRNVVTSVPVLNIDLAPTILDIADVDAAHEMDGESFLPALNTVPGTTPKRDFLIEYRGEGGHSTECYDDPNVKLCSPSVACKCFDSRNNTYDCLRRFGKDLNEIFCRFHDEELFAELYDMTKDPFQMENLAPRLGMDGVRCLDDHLRFIKREILKGERIIVSQKPGN